MREKCARVLAAALMTGAIGFALAMPAIFETAHKAGRLLTAPPSFLQRSVHVVASAPSRSARDGRLEGTQPIQPASFVPAASRSGSARNGGSTTASSRHPSRAGRSEPAPKPAPKPTPAPAPASPTRELADTTPPTAVSPPAPSQPAVSPGGKGKGKKKPKQQHKPSKGKPAEAPQPPVPATTPQPANESPATEGEKGHGHGNDKGQDKGKSDDKGRDG